MERKSNAKRFTDRILRLIRSAAAVAGLGKKPRGTGDNAALLSSRRLDRPLSFRLPRAAPLVRITIDCGRRQSVDVAVRHELADAPNAPRKKERRQTVDWVGWKCPPVSPSSPRLSSSSSVYDGDDVDCRGVFSSRSFSSDSQDQLDKRAAAAELKHRKPTSSQSCRYRWELQDGPASFELADAAPPRSSAADSGGFAVVKRSADPYEDFRASMREMVDDWQVANAGDMRRLLDAYIALNSPRHYAAILAAYADVRDVVLSGDGGAAAARTDSRCRSSMSKKKASIF